GRVVARGNRRLCRTPDQRWRTCHCHDGSLYFAKPQTTQRAGPALARLNGKGKECMAKVVVLLSPTQRTRLLQIPVPSSSNEPRDSISSWQPSSYGILWNWPELLRSCGVKGWR